MSDTALVTDEQLHALSKQPNTTVLKHEHVHVRDEYPADKIQSAVACAHAKYVELFKSTPNATLDDDKAAAGRIMDSLPPDVQQICKDHPSFTAKITARQTAMDPFVMQSLYFVIGLRRGVQQGRMTEEEAQKMFVDRMLRVTAQQGAAKSP